jgi:hypothetical protein
MDHPMPAPRTRSGLVTLAVCVGLLVVFTSVAWLAIGTKSPTFDEPYHALSAWTNLHYFDYRIDCEDPPLWKYWAALPNGKDALSANFSVDSWTSQPQKLQLEFPWTVQTLYRTAENNSSDRFVRRSRAMMLVFGPLLGGLIGWWAWRIGGGVAAIVATGLFCLDPNFIAHAPLVKNDVVFSLVMCALVYNLWRAGQRLTWLRMLAVALLCGVMLTVKFSGPLAGVLTPLMLGIRAMLPTSWRALGRDRTTRLSRLAIAAGVTLLAAGIGIGSIWAAYGFRFAPTPQQNLFLNTSELFDTAAQKEFALHEESRPSLFLRSLRFAEDHHLLPQAWVGGMLFTYQSALIRPAFMLGQISLTGWRIYFPFAMLVKTPVATLLAAVAAVAVIFWRRPRGWTTFCLLIPFLIYVQTAMRSNMNIGIRHVLPLYPLMYVTIGWAAAVALRRYRKVVTGVLVLLAIPLLAESLSVFPNYIPFFNVAAGGSTAGIYLLGDSNLDWGQDLLLLAKWQRENSQTPLYLSYFGLADPAYYGIKYTPLPGGYGFDSNPAWPDGVCVLAISATNLQGLFVDPNLSGKFYQPLAGRPPREILGGTIYLYDYSKVADLVSAQRR